MGQAGQALIALALRGSDDDRSWAAPLARAALDRKLSCEADGAVLTGAGPALDALSRTPREPDDAARSPTLNLKNRGILEIVILAGCYDLVSSLLNAFEVPVPA